MSEQASLPDYHYNSKVKFPNDHAQNPVELGIEKFSWEPEQFMSDTLHTLAKIVQDQTIEWLKRLPDGIGAFKKGNRDAVFVLFRNGSDLYWRTKYFYGDREVSDSINVTIAILLDREAENDGERIDYGRLLVKE